MRERQIRLDRAHSNKKGEQWTLASPPERRGAAPEGAWARAEESARPPRPVQSAPKKTKTAPRAPAVYSAPPQRPSAKKGRRAARGALSFVGMTALFLLLSLGAFTGLRALLGRASGGPAQPAGAGVQEPIVTEAAWDPAGPPYVVAVDPGHGGADRGAEGYAVEVEMTERTTDELIKILEADPNYTPVRTRQNGEGKSIADRVDTAVAAGAAMLLSIHGNSDETGTAVGFECYPQTPGLAYHSYSVRLAHHIADAVAATGQSLRGQSGVRYIYYKGSEEAGYEKTIVEESDTSVHEEQTFGVLQRAQFPAVLAEQCFLTHAGDANDWATPSGCRLAAKCYYRAICAFFGTQPIALEGF